MTELSLTYYIMKKGKENGGKLTKGGRGSGASFITNTLLGFSDVDRLSAPVHMYPERFMSTTRILMNDIDTYCSRMRKSVCEKLFFLDRDEFKNCNTIIDFGCADGSLISEMKQIFPQKTYIGVDNNPNMRKLANSKLDGSVKIYRNLQEIREVCAPVGVILSSVLHEVFTFYSNKKIRELLTEIASISDFVFVRDMLSPSSYVSPLSIYSVNRRNIERHPLWWSFYKKWGHSTIGTNFISVRDAMHFFLKSKYENN